MAEELEGRVEDIERSVQSLETQVRALIARTQTTTRVVLVVGIIVIAAVFAYLAWLSYKINEFAEPVEFAGIVMETMQPGEKVQKLLDMVEEGLTEDVSGNVRTLLAQYLPKLPDAIRRAEQGLVARAPETTARLLDLMVQEMPTLRARAEARALQLVDAFLDKVDEHADQVIGEVLTTRKAELEPLIEVASTEGTADELEEAFEKSLEELIGRDLDEVLHKYYWTMVGLERRLARLQDPEALLSPEQQFEKELIISVLLYLDEAIEAQEQAAPPAR